MTAQDRRRWWALGALAVSVLAVGLDLTVLNLALPALAGSLHAGTGDLQWFIAAYSLVLAAALLPAGLAGDRLGRRKVLTGALALFGAASLACAYATSSGELIAARAVLGLAAAAILPLSLAVIPVMFTPAEQPRAIALLGGMTFLGYPVGPILGGWLLDHFWWGSVFLVNVPVAVIAVVAVAVLMPESRSEQRPRLDVAGMLVSAAGLAALTYGVIKAGQDGWGDPAALLTMAAGAVALCVFVRLELRRGRAGRQPLADLTLFRSARFGWGTALATLVSFTLFGVLFGIPLYFRDVRGLDSLGSGLRLVPMMVGMGVGLVVGQRLQTPGAGRRSTADERAGAGHRRAGDHGGRAGGWHANHGDQRRGICRGVARGDRPGPGAGPARHAGRRAERADPRAQRVGLGADHRVAAGRRHAGGSDAGHAAQRGVPVQPGAPARAAGRRGSGRAQRRVQRGRGGPRGGVG